MSKKPQSRKPLKATSCSNQKSFQVQSFRVRKYTFRPTSSQLRIPNEQESIMSSELPPIPQPSEALKVLLFKFNSMNEVKTKKVCLKNVLNAKPRKSNYGNINAFLAFRTFYCKNIQNPDHQIILSRSLAKIWKMEQNKLQWDLYACLYNIRSLRSLPFVQWLCKGLRLEQPINPSSNQEELRVVKTDNELYKTTKINNTIEDVYLINSMECNT
uniref:MAT alpha 1 protein n=1 Tax=Suhomyces bokatorum TaxID=246048 RepID=A0A3Q9FFP3_9ASCO|nr:MAT alpha 1 protein [Suhomyces bokatorum]AZQ56715.1 MAT alpha 1 protein [Suhomyces bokatorum]AZQ56721.1 MAT alpha 1 protein [Suhomyces bokatorum]AZQ56728.1 MAT alpha 1 protein [Suhomyces bokatorum]AZQ56734.1 MAT alpha 1 protein [Suhomyces bokatorum]